MRAKLTALRRGEIDFERFARDTVRDWDGIADSMVRKWEVPAGVEAADVRQELMLAAWQKAKDFDPDRGVSFDRFMIWNAYDKAIKWLHRQRGTRKTYAAKAPRSFSEVGDVWVNRQPSQDPLPDARADRMGDLARVFSRLEAGAPRLVLSMLLDADGDTDEVARIILDNPRIRLALQVSDDGSVRRLVLRTLRMVRRVARELDAA